MEPEELLEEAAQKLSKLPAVVELEEKHILVLGDTHGFPEVTEWGLKLAEENNIPVVVMLGDYVDRGPRGVENLELVAQRLLEDQEPRLIPLRGNHEDPEMNFYYGFHEEAVNKRGRGYLEAVSHLYTCLPVAVKAPGIAMLHGGVPCRECRDKPETPVSLGETGQKLGEKRCSQSLVDTYSDPLLRHITWNDPRAGIDWFIPSPRGPGIYLYGREAWRSFLEANGARLLIRAHEVVDAARIDSPSGGTEELGKPAELSLEDLEWSVVTVFSSLYHGLNAGALELDLEEGVARLYLYPRRL